MKDDDLLEIASVTTYDKNVPVNLKDMPDIPANFKVELSVLEKIVQENQGNEFVTLSLKCERRNGGSGSGEGQCPPPPIW